MIWTMPAIILWPNSDAGSDGISRAIRKFRETRDARLLHFFKNLPVDEYIWLMRKKRSVLLETLLAAYAMPHL